MKRMHATDRKRYEVLKRMLEDRRREIQEKLRSLRETLPAEADLVKDAEEQSVDDFIQEVDFALMEMKSETLAKIDEAIRRLENGTYGVCVECGGEIAEARLTALPFAALCRSCQEREEARDAEDREARAFEGHFARAFP
jgi:DnaK suppressor protein